MYEFMMILAESMTLKEVLYKVFEISLIINLVMIIYTHVMYFNQYFHGFVGVCVKKKVWPEAKNNHKYAYIICARNEQKVIGNLIDSIYNQDYPRELMQVFVVADNCSDETALVAKNHNAIVYERFDKINVGKSYALDYILNILRTEKQYEDFEAYFVFDADNLVSKKYTYEMNKLFDSGVKVATSLRDIKNYNDSWISAGQGMSFYREHLLIHHSRSRLNIGTYISGTGFFVSKEIIDKFGGWKFNTMIEDIEFSINCGLNDIKIEYCEDAVFYDEQPVKFKDSIKQRLRWSKGVLQNYQKYNFKLMKKFAKKPNLTVLDLKLHVTPIALVSFVWTVVYVILNTVFVLTNIISLDDFLSMAISGTIGFIISAVAFFVLHAIFVTIRYGKKIKAPWYKQVLYCLTFAIFMMLYLPILFVAMFTKPKWEPIEHKDSKTIDNM